MVQIKCVYYFAGAQRVAVRERYPGPMLYGADKVSYLLSDHLGSTSVTANADGTLLSRTLYSAWGEVRYSSGALPTKYTYTGQYNNTADFGLMYYRARWYDPSLGRFSQADTIVPGAMAIDFDRYAYVRNSPTGAVDPSGHVCQKVGNNTVCSHDDDSNGWQPVERQPIDEATLLRIAFLVWADAGRGQVEQYSREALEWMTWVFINRYNYNRSGGRIDMDTGGTPSGLKRVGYPYDGTTDLNENIDAAVAALLDETNKDHKTFKLVLDRVLSTYRYTYLAMKDDPTRGALFFNVVNQKNTVTGKYFEDIQSSIDYLEMWSRKMRNVYSPQRAKNDGARYPFTYGFSNTFIIDGIPRFLYVSNNACSSYHACQPNYSTK